MKKESLDHETHPRGWKFSSSFNEVRMPLKFVILKRREDLVGKLGWAKWAILAVDGQSTLPFMAHSIKSLSTFTNSQKSHPLTQRDGKHNLKSLMVFDELKIFVFLLPLSFQDHQRFCARMYEQERNDTERVYTSF